MRFLVPLLEREVDFPRTESERKWTVQKSKTYELEWTAVLAKSEWSYYESTLT